MGIKITRNRNEEAGLTQQLRNDSAQLMTRTLERDRWQVLFPIHLLISECSKSNFATGQGDGKEASSAEEHRLR